MTMVHSQRFLDPRFDGWPCRSGQDAASRSGASQLCLDALHRAGANPESDGDLAQALVAARDGLAYRLLFSAVDGRTAKALTLCPSAL